MIGRLRADERGITPVLGAALVLGVIILTLSAFLAIWIPSETNRRESEHMSGVEGSFRELRSAIESLEVGESKSVHLKMGPEPIPFVSNPGTGGTLSVLPSTGEKYGVIMFSLGNQRLVYESGMIILVQDNVDLMKSDPRVVTWGKVGDKLEVHFDNIKVRGLESSVSGNGTSTLTASIYRENEGEVGLLENVTIQINSSYVGAWGEYLQGLKYSLAEEGYDSEVDMENLQITILENVRYYQKVTEVWVSIS